MAAAAVHEPAHEEDGSSAEPYRSSGASELDVEVGKPEKDCRICHMTLASSSPEPRIPIELGCSCKGDLAAAHKDCAETWFRIRGNRTCEICGSVARNLMPGVVAENGNETNGESAAATAAQRGSFWRGHRLVNFLLACMVFAFVISWLFHFNGPG